MQKRRWILAIVVFLVIVLAGTYGAAWLLMPARTEYGATWETYRREPRDSIDVLYFGSSLAYCNIVPGVVWEESGITSYVMAGPEQTIPITYSYIKETCRTQKPKVIAIEATGMFYSQYCNFTKANIAYMPYSVNRLEAAIRAAEPELKLGLLFPILDYHSLWTSVSARDVAKHLNPGTDVFAGYTYLEKIEPQSGITVRGYRADTENYARNLEYLHRIRKYCQKEGIQLLLFITPTTGRVAEPALTQLKADVAQLENVRFMDFNDVMSELNVDDSTDWYDFIHFNCRGAEKFSRYLGGYLQNELGLGATEGEDEALWQARAREFADRLKQLN
jgi:hypothetical protein